NAWRQKIHGGSLCRHSPEDSDSVGDVGENRPTPLRQYRPELRAVVVETAQDGLLHVGISVEPRGNIPLVPRPRRNRQCMVRLNPHANWRVFWGQKSKSLASGPPCGWPGVA